MTRKAVVLAPIAADMCGCSFGGLSCKERTLFVLGLFTIAGAAFTLVLALLISVLGVAWVVQRNSGDLGTLAAAFLVPLYVAAFAQLAVGILSAFPGSGACCRASPEKRRCYLITALLLRLVPIACVVYFFAFVGIVAAQRDPSPPSPPVVPLGSIAPRPADPPYSPFPPSFPPAPPYAPFDPGAGGPDLFGILSSVVSLAGLLLAPIFEIIVLCDLRKGGTSDQVAGV